MENTPAYTFHFFKCIRSVFLLEICIIIRVILTSVAQTEGPALTPLVIGVSIFNESEKSDNTTCT